LWVVRSGCKQERHGLAFSEMDGGIARVDGDGRRGARERHFAEWRFQRWQDALARCRRCLRYQRFSASTTALKLKIRYSLSDDCTLGKTGDKLVPPLTSDALDEACGVSSNVNISISNYELWKVLVVAGGWVMSEDMVSKFMDSAGTGAGEKTFSTDINTWSAAFTDCDLCLCFPPGQGSVTLTEVKLVAPGQ
jgi:hypothetical protein